LLLKASLGGNAKTVMLCALSPAEINFDESLSTLRYANRAKMIQNKPTGIIIKDPKDSLIKDYQNKISEMTNLLNDPNALKNKLKEMNPDDTDDQLQERISQYEDKLSEFNNALIDKDKLISDQKDDKKKMYFNAQIQINKMKIKRDLELFKIKKASKQMKKNYNDINEELAAMKVKCANLEEELEEHILNEEENLHEINSDKEELKLINEELYKELLFNKAVLYS